MSNEELFAGIAVVVDDELNDEKSDIAAIRKQVEAKSSHIIGFTDVPSEEQVKALSGAAFFVVDWNLRSADATGMEGLNLPSTLVRENADRTLGLLRLLKKYRVAPVVIFTNADVDDVINQIKDAEIDSEHLLVKSKAEVRASGVFTSLAAWIEKAPAAYVLRHWEVEYERAKQAFFFDFYAKSSDWPLILWKAFVKDDVPPADEIGRVIQKNIQSRMQPFSFDLSNAQERDTFDRKAILKVYEGERYIENSGLHADSIAPGDVYKTGGAYYVNLRPECDCIARSGDEANKLDLYLVKGESLSPAKHQEREDLKHGKLIEHDVESVIFPIDNGKTIIFKFKKLYTKSWGDLRTKRIGRLLPPHLTRLQERYAAYLQRPGLARLPDELFTVKTTEKEEADKAVGGEGADCVIVQVD